MSLFNDAMIEAMRTGKYICSQCGSLMEFEDPKWRDTLICPKCGHNIDLDYYGCEDDEDYDALYPTKEEVVGRDDAEDDDNPYGETYDEVYGELSGD